jgi:lipopolysaccharide transport system permease protein
MSSSISDLPMVESARAATAPPVIRLRPRSGWSAVNFQELWEYRELLGFLAARDIKVRYKQTALGVLWAIFQPLVTMLVFTVFLHRFGNIGADDPNYAINTFCALLPWNLFAYALTQSSNSLVVNQQLLTKLYFPRLLIPFSSVLSGVVDFAIGILILLALMAWNGMVPSTAIWTLPALMVMALAAALAVGLWLSAMNVMYRDVRYLVPFLTQIWMFVSPVAYRSSDVPEKWRLLYGLNPMAGVIEGFRWALLGHGAAPGRMLAVSAAATAVLLIGGLYYFRRMERIFADVV